ncbi:MAG: glycosyl transferase family 1, partial [Desulfovibrio sp.]|nr:glycosyl transferase family 1 [Desulfovibrio sp.]
HHWNTPPLAASPPANAADISTAGIPESVLSAKLANLLAAAGDFCGERPTSFRMGRWDIRRAHWPLLARAGIACDASVRPLHCHPSGPDHFAAPANPYRIPAAGTSIFEVPLTVTPLFRSLPRRLERLAAKAPGRLGPLARAALKNWGALALLPVYHPLWLMQLVTRIFAARGGTVLSLTWHSSEMMPGGAPHVPDAAAVDGLLHKIYRYVHWVYENFSARACTMRELAAEMGPRAEERAAPAGDWTSG